MRKLTARQQAQNAAFLAALRRTGNARLAARDLGVNRSTYTKRRARDPAFAAEWDAALAAFRSTVIASPQGTAIQTAPPLDRHGANAPRDDGQGQPLVLTRLKNGRVQLRRQRPGTIGPTEETAFLTALAASANVRLAAAAAGFAHSSFYARKGRNRAFAREMRAALKFACTNLQAELLASALPEQLESTAWRHNDLPAIPRLTVDQALQLLHLHQKSVELGWDKPHRRRRRNEPWEVYTQRLAAMWMAEKRMEREDDEIRRALQNLPPAPLSRHPGLDPGSVLMPSLDQVTGWSKAKGNAPHNPNLALFGGWRLKDWKACPP